MRKLKHKKAEKVVIIRVDNGIIVEAERPDKNNHCFGSEYVKVKQFFNNFAEAFPIINSLLTEDIYEEEKEPELVSL